MTSHPSRHSSSAAQRAAGQADAEAEPEQARAQAVGHPADRAERDRNTPVTIKVGQSIVIGKHQILPGWKATKAEYLDTFEVTAKVTNIGDETSSSLMEMKFLKGNEVVGDVMLTSNPLEPGQIQKLNGLSDDEFVKYDRITVEASSDTDHLVMNARRTRLLTKPRIAKLYHDGLIGLGSW
jgi:hypothetical protein